MRNQRTQEPTFAYSTGIPCRQFDRQPICEGSSAVCYDRTSKVLRPHCYTETWVKYLCRKLAEPVEYQAVTGKKPISTLGTGASSIQSVYVESRNPSRSPEPDDRFLYRLKARSHTSSYLSRYVRSTSRNPNFSYSAKAGFWGVVVLRTRVRNPWDRHQSMTVWVNRVPTPRRHTCHLRPVSRLSSATSFRRRYSAA